MVTPRRATWVAAVPTSNRAPVLPPRSTVLSIAMLYAPSGVREAQRVAAVHLVVGDLGALDRRVAARVDRSRVPGRGVRDDAVAHRQRTADVDRADRGVGSLRVGEDLDPVEHQLRAGGVGVDRRRELGLHAVLKHSHARQRQLREAAAKRRGRQPGRASVDHQVLDRHRPRADGAELDDGGVDRRSADDRVGPAGAPDRDVGVGLVGGGDDFAVGAGGEVHHVRARLSSGRRSSPRPASTARPRSRSWARRCRPGPQTGLRPGRPREGTRRPPATRRRAAGDDGQFGVRPGE